MELPITFPFLLTILSFSLYYDIKERRIPNWIHIYSSIFLSIFYLILSIYFEYTLFPEQLYYVFQFFLFLLIIYFFSALNAGDIKLLLTISYAIPYFYLKYVIFPQIPFLSLFLNFGLVGLLYFFFTLNLNTIKKNKSKVLLNFVNFLILILPSVSLTRAIFGIFSGYKILTIEMLTGSIILFIIFLRIVSLLLREALLYLSRNELWIIVLIISILSSIYLIYENLLYIFLFVIFASFIVSLYLALKDEEEMKKQSIPATVIIIIGLVLTLIFNGDILVYLKYHFSNLFK